MKVIKVRTNKDLVNKAREYRTNGYNIITLGSKVAEVEKNNEIVRIER